MAPSPALPFPLPGPSARSQGGRRVSGAEFGASACRNWDRLQSPGPTGHLELPYPRSGLKSLTLKPAPPSKSTTMPTGSRGQRPWRRRPHRKRRITHQLFKEHVRRGLRGQASGSSPTPGQAWMLIQASPEEFTQKSTNTGAGPLGVVPHSPFPSC